MSRMTGPQVSAVAAATVLLTAIALAGAGRGCSRHADDVTERFPLDAVVIDTVAADTVKVSPRKAKKRGTTHSRKPVVRSHRDEVVSDRD